MKKILLFLIPFLLCTALQDAQNMQPLSADREIKLDITNSTQNKLSARLHAFLNDPEIITAAKEKINAEHSMLHENIPARMINNKVQIGMLIRVNDAATLRKQIESVGGVFESMAGDIMAAKVPITEAGNIALSDAAAYSDICVSRQPMLNNSRAAIQADVVQAGTNLPKGYTGKGVVVGVVDSGIDWTYSDFKNSSGSRIQYMWDMSGASGAPAGYTYGTEYTKQQIDASFCTEADLADGEGHGTHVSCIAAGNGKTNGIYTGIATNSDLVFVKGFASGPSFADDDVINGCTYIFAKADALSEPAVINLSLGGQYGPHDGSSTYESALSNLTGPGKIICASAGNDGGSDIHLRYTATGASTAASSITPLSIPSGTSAVLIDMWYPASGTINVGLALYSGSTLLGYTTPVIPGGTMNKKTITMGGTSYGILTIDASTAFSAYNSCREAIIYLTNGTGTYDLTKVTWCLYTYGTGAFDAWIDYGASFSTVNSGNIKGGDNAYSVGVPGTAKKVICVGSYVTAPSWPSINGHTYHYASAATKDSLSSFSSMGPSRDGRLKPDIVAPGQAIISALSTSLKIGTDVDSSWVVPGGKHRVMQGTSMAAPHATGVIAMMLEKNPKLTYDQVYSILTSSATKDSYTGQSGTDLYGYGKLNALSAIQATATDVKAALKGVTDYKLYRNYPNPFNPSTKISFDLPVQGNVTLKVYDVLGKEVATLINGVKAAGHQEIEFNADNFPTGVYIYQLKAGGNIYSNKMLLVK